MVCECRWDIQRQVWLELTVGNYDPNILNETVRVRTLRLCFVTEYKTTLCYATKRKLYGADHNGH